MLPRMLPNDNFTKRSCAKNNHNSLIWLAVPRGVEPPTFGLGNRCSIPELSPHRSTRYLRLVDVDFESNSLGNTSHISHGIEAAWPNRTAKALSANSTRCAELGGLTQRTFHPQC